MSSLVQIIAHIPLSLSHPGTSLHGKHSTSLSIFPSRQGTFSPTPVLDRTSERDQRVKKRIDIRTSESVTGKSRDGHADGHMKCSAVGGDGGPVQPRWYGFVMLLFMYPLNHGERVWKLSFVSLSLLKSILAHGVFELMFRT